VTEEIICQVEAFLPKSSEIDDLMGNVETSYCLTKPEASLF
jgi:hypothetical protein